MARVTILADASWCPQTGAAGYGYWIASDRGRLGGGDELREALCNNSAEMQAIVNALYVARKKELVLASDYVLVQTDSLRAIGVLTGSLTPNSNEASAYKAYREFVGWLGASCIQLKHVKGHTSRKSHTEARYGANRMCDLRAGRAMRAMRRRLQEERLACKS